MHGPAGADLARSPARRLADGATRARPDRGPRRQCAEPGRAAAGAAGARRAAGDGARRPSAVALLAGLGARPARGAAGRRELRPVGRHPRPLPGLQARSGGNHRRGGPLDLKEGMQVDGKPYRTIRLGPDGTTVQVIDQTLLPHAFVVRDLTSVEDAERAIRTMIVRGAPLIGATAAYGVALAMAADPSDATLARAYDVLLASRPTAVNLRWALDDLRALLMPMPQARRRDAAYGRAAEICDEDV